MKYKYNTHHWNTFDLYMCIKRLYIILFIYVAVAKCQDDNNSTSKFFPSNGKKILNIGYFTSCDYNVSDSFSETVCISILTPANYFIVRKSCFLSLMKKTESMYIYYNNTFSTINYMIETPNNFYVKSNETYNNQILSQYVSFTNTTMMHLNHTNIYAILYAGNIMLNLTDIQADNQILNNYSDFYFRHDIFNGKINYFTLPIFPRNISSSIIYPNYTKQFGCDDYSFNINSFHFFNDRCEIAIDVY